MHLRLVPPLPKYVAHTTQMSHVGQVQQAVACLVRALHTLQAAGNAAVTPLLTAAVMRMVRDMATSLQHTLMSDRGGSAGSAGAAQPMPAARKAAVRVVCKQLQAAMMPR